MISYDLLADIALTRITNPTAKIILLELAKYSNAKGECFPSQLTLADGACVSERTARDVLHWLEEHGFVEIVHRHNTSNFYIITSMKEEPMDRPANSAAEGDNISKIDFTKRKSNTSYPANSAGRVDDPFFLSFWQAYPRRIGKGEARIAFAKACRNADANQIVQAAIAYAAHCQEMNIGPQYRPHPATWLNQERWEDDLDGEKKQQSKSGWGDALDGL